jgi:hypothetical protein
MIYALVEYQFHFYTAVFLATCWRIVGVNGFRFPEIFGGDPCPINSF